MTGRAACRVSLVLPVALVAQPLVETVRGAAARAREQGRASAVHAAASVNVLAPDEPAIGLVPT